MAKVVDFEPLGALYGPGTLDPDLLHFQIKRKQIESNQSINQSNQIKLNQINQSTNESINQSIHESINESFAIPTIQNNPFSQPPYQA